MTLDGVEINLTTHGRMRFSERIGEFSDEEMLVLAHHGVEGYKFVWGKTGTRKWNLVTVLYRESSRYAS